MKFFNLFQKSISYTTAFFLFVVSFPSLVYGQNFSPDPGFVTAVSAFTAQPYYQQGGSFDGGAVGLCVIGTVQSSDSTQVQVRYTPYITGATTADLVWQYSPFVIDVAAQTEVFNLTVVNGINPAQSYILELVEITTGQVFHTITPNNSTDSFAFSCSPATDGSFPSDVNCGNSNTVLTECGPSSGSVSNNANSDSLGNTQNQTGQANQNNANPSSITINVDVANSPELAGENINEGLVQCGFGQSYDCDFNALLETIDRVLKFLLYIIVLPLAAILFAVAGIKLVIAREKGKEAAMSDAKTLFGNVVIGLALALGAWIIVKFVLVILGYTDASGVLTQILGITTTE